MIWECGEGQWRAVYLIQLCSVSLLDWEIDLRGSWAAGPKRLCSVFGGSWAGLLLGPASNAMQAFRSMKATWVRPLIIDHWLPSELQHGPVCMSLKKKEDEVSEILLSSGKLT